MRLPIAAGSAAALLSTAVSAGAQSAPSGDALLQLFVDGVYSSEENCASGDPGGAHETHLQLGPFGFSAIEYNCEFVDARASASGDIALITGICSEPGFVSPEIFTLHVWSDGPSGPILRLTAGSGAGSVETLFYACGR